MPLAPPRDYIPRIALFIDFDNGQLDISRILDGLRERGIIILRKAYGDWGKFAQHRKVLAEHGVELVERPTIHAGGDKNGADIQLAVDALEACLTNQFIDVFAIVSGDSDFLPLILRLQNYNKKVVIVGMRKTTSSVVMKNCNEYLAYENLGRAPSESGSHGGVESGLAPGAEVDPKDIRVAFALMSRAIGLLEDEDKTVDSALLKQKMLQLSPTFDEKTFGFGQFKAFLAEAQKEKIIHIGKREAGVYPISLGRAGKKLEDEEPMETPETKPVSKKRVRKRRR
jgi:uncharacterized protein (TIGR00288 family)